MMIFSATDVQIWVFLLALALVDGEDKIVY